MAFPTLLQSLELAVLAPFLYASYLIIYRLFFHPLASFPGPKFTAATQWYEIYYDVVRDGRFIWEIERMHERYGPIVRINPEEVHIKDSDFFSTIYSGPSRKRDKDETWAMMAGAPRSAFSTPDHDVHKMRRGALNPFFSKRTVTKLEPRIAGKVQILCDRFKEFMERKQVIHLHTACSAFTMDVISEYCYGEDGCTNYLLDRDFNPKWAQCMQDVFDNAAFRRSVPWLTASLQKLPVDYVLKMMPSMEVLIRWQMDLKKQVGTVVRDYETSKEKKETIFHSLLDNEELPEEEKSLRRLADEAEILVAAGSETTARTIAYTSFYVINTPGVLDKLRAELKTIMPSRDQLPSWTELEKLPYLTGVVQEGLRLTFGATTRSPRVPHEAVTYGDWVIPARTPISATTYFVSTDPAIFPEPFEFKPERWIRIEGDSHQRLDRYMTNFSKGTRSCVGINLAYSEMYLVIAAIFRRFDFELHETSIEDVRMVRDKFVTGPAAASKGVRVVVMDEVSVE